MDLESQCSVLASVEDNEEIKNVPILEKLGNIGDSKVQNNGCCEVENNENNELLSDVKGMGTDILGSVSSPPVEIEYELSPSPAMTRKGYGLKKWRRITRDVSKGGDSRVDTGKMVMQELSNPAVNPSKRTQVYAERHQKSEDSVSSTDPLVGTLDVFALLGESGLALGPSVDAGTDSENSKDQSIKSSTAASVPKIKYERPAVVGFPHDMLRMRSLGGKNWTHSMQCGQQGKGRIESIKKARGEQVKIEKENSHSSMESDSRSSNFVYMQGTYAATNGMQIEGRLQHDGENGDEVQCSEQQVSDGLQGGCGRDSVGGYEDVSPEYVVADSSWEVKNERSKNHGSSSEQDPVVESIFALQTAQEALEKEVLKFKEISKDASVDDAVSDTQPEFRDVEQKLPESRPEQFRSGEGVESFSGAVQSEVVENIDLETEVEDLFKKRIEVEVVYLTMSRMVQKLRPAAVDCITLLEEQKADASARTQINDELGDSENKAARLKKDIASVEEALKLQKRVYKYTSYFFVQLLSLIVILGVFIFQSSPNYVEVVPT